MSAWRWFRSDDRAFWRAAVFVSSLVPAIGSTATPRGSPCEGRSLPRSGFIANEGQWPERVRFAALGEGYTVWLEERSIAIHTRHPASTARIALELPLGTLSSVGGDVDDTVFHFY